MYSGEIPREHRAISFGEKNGRAAAARKSRAACEKSGGEAPRAWKWGKPRCVWSANHYEKYGRAAAGEKVEREAPGKKNRPAAPGEKIG